MEMLMRLRTEIDGSRRRSESTLSQRVTGRVLFLKPIEQIMNRLEKAEEKLHAPRQAIETMKQIKGRNLWEIGL
jgi:hypothetical protein